MKLTLRTTKTSSGATAVQVVRYEHRRTVVVRHVGSTQDAHKLVALKQTARAWIRATTHQTSLFPSPSCSGTLLLEQCRYLGFRYGLLHETLTNIFTRFKFHLLHHPLLTDLVLARIIEPGSKLQSLEFLKQFLGIGHSRCELYRQIPTLLDLQERVEHNVLTIAKKQFSFTCSLVFYDVTTLYFESFTEDTLRLPGFSKDNKPQQPQILIGLLVTEEGFPVAYQVFKGNTFEGHTLIPVISAFKRKHRVGKLTVVADAAMMSLENVEALRQSNLQYVVAARTASLSPDLIEKLSGQLNQQDGATVRVPTGKYGDLICEFSTKRFAKDQREMKNQITKAQELLKHPSSIKRTKFIKVDEQAGYSFNTELEKKTQLLLGLKGYYTNLGPEVSEQMIIKQYHNLWHVEHAFRMTKSDLLMRPMFHFKEQTIKAHILICFMALAVCKYMELKTGKSTKYVLKHLKSVTDARLMNTITNEEFILRAPLNPETEHLLASLRLSY